MAHIPFPKSALALAALLLVANVTQASSTGLDIISHERIELALRVLGYDVNKMVAHDAAQDTWYEVYAVKDGRRVIVVLDDTMSFVRHYDYGALR